MRLLRCIGGGVYFPALASDDRARCHQRVGRAQSPSAPPKGKRMRRAKPRQCEAFKASGAGGGVMVKDDRYSIYASGM